MLPPSPSGVSTGMAWCHLSVSVYLEHTHTHTQRPNTTSITSLYCPSLDSVALFPSQKLPHQQPSKYTLHPSLSTHQQWRRNPSFGRGERGISCLSSSQHGCKWRESFTNWCLRMMGRKKRGLLPCVCVKSFLVHICVCCCYLLLASYTSLLCSSYCHLLSAAASS